MGGYEEAVKDTTPRRGALGENLGEKKIIIGDVKKPFFVGKASECRAMLTDEFYAYFHVWRLFHAGFGLPDNRAWNDQDPTLIEVLLTMQENYVAHYENLKLTSILEYSNEILKVGFRVK